MTVFLAAYEKYSLMCVGGGVKMPGRDDNPEST